MDGLAIKKLPTFSIKLITYNGKGLKMSQRYTIKHSQRAGKLTSFFHNGNFHIGDILKFSGRSWYSFSTKQEAENHIDYINLTLKNQSHYFEGLQTKLIKFAKKLYITLD